MTTTIIAPAISGADQNTDNDQLSAPAPERPAEHRTKTNEEYAAFARRIVRAYARRVAAGDVEALAALVALSDELETAVRDAVSGLRNFGYSWTEIADRLGVTRQGARQRWMGRPDQSA